MATDELTPAAGPTRGPAQEPTLGGPDHGAAEAAVIERVRRGDTEAYDLLVRQYLRRAYAVAYRLLGHREDAEYFVQEAFMAALDRIESFEPGRPFAPWFFRIIVNRGLNARKARSRRYTEAIPETAVDPGGSPEHDAERSELHERLDTAMAELTPRQRLIVQFVDVEGWDASQVATTLEIAPGTVRWHLHQARAVLRRTLAREGEMIDATG